MRHELETDYIGVQEALFSNMDNTTLPDDIVEHIRNTEEAVISESCYTVKPLSPVNWSLSVLEDNDILCDIY